MTPSQNMHGTVGFIAAIVTSIAAIGWVLAPDKANTWVIGVATMAIIWIVVTVIGRTRSFNQQSNDERRYLLWSVAGGGIILSLSMALKLAMALGFDDQVGAKRGLGIFAGIILVFLGNMLPKILSPLLEKRCVPKQVQSIQRLAGWSFALAGLTSIGSWIFLANESASDVTTAVVALALIVIVARSALAFASRTAAKNN